MLKRASESKSEPSSSDEDESDDEDDADDEDDEDKDKKPLRQSRPPIPSSSSSVPEHRTSNYTGVNWVKAKRKWIGRTSDVMAERSTTAKKKAPKLIYTKYFDDEDACYRALEALRATINAKNETLWAAQASEDPLTMNVERGPDDIQDAVRGNAYWIPHRDYNHIPKRMVVVIKKADKQHGMAWASCCQHVDPSTGMGSCSTMAHASKPNEPAIFCMTHGGKCPCGRNYYACRVCLNPRNGKKKQSAKMCKRCNFTQIDGKRKLGQGGNGLCPACETDLKQEAVKAGATKQEANKLLNGKKMEDVVLDQLTPLIVDSTTGFGIPYESRDDHSNMLGSNKHHRRNECDTEHQRRPDVCYLRRCKEFGRILAAIFVEVDEHCHESYKLDCELGKLDDTYESVAKFAQTEGKSTHAVVSIDHTHIPLVYTFKFNPNATGMGSKTQFPLKERVQVLAQKVNALLNKPDSYFTDELTETYRSAPVFETLYYMPDNPHLLAYKQKTAEGWDWTFLGNSHPRLKCPAD